MSDVGVFPAPELRTDAVHEHALPQLSGLPLMVLLGKTTTIAHVAPITSTQCVCMEILTPPNEMSPVQMGCYEEMSGRKKKGRGEGTYVARRVSDGQRSSSCRKEE